MNAKLRSRTNDTLCGRKGNISGNTIKNLEDSFAGESKARNRYMMFAEKARMEGYDDVATTFEEIASQEVMHAKSIYKVLVGGIKGTKKNLMDSIGGESYEEDEMYPAMIKTARKEGNEEAAKVFESIYRVEGKHKDTFKRYLKKYF